MEPYCYVRKPICHIEGNNRKKYDQEVEDVPGLSEVVEVESEELEAELKEKDEEEDVVDELLIAVVLPVVEANAHRQHIEPDASQDEIFEAL